MPTAIPPNARAGSAEPANNYDQDVDDFFRDLDVDRGNTNAANVDIAPAKDVDEEITVRKKRAPAPKLDENRLLSDNGIPKLRRIAKTKLKFKGKGHEFSDIGRLLNTYQLWLDDLYPKAKFRDALGMVEKVGHSKRMQVMRRAWIDGTKPSRRAESVERVEDVEMSGGLEGRLSAIAEDDIFGDSAALGDPEGETQANERDGMPDDDELDALMAENTAPAARPQQHPERRPMFEEEDDEPDEDELDALMAENVPAAPKPSLAQQKAKSGPFAEEDDEPDEDDLDALLAVDATASKPTTSALKAQESQTTQPQDDFDDDEEAMASMGGMS